MGRNPIRRALALGKPNLSAVVVAELEMFTARQLKELWQEGRVGHLTTSPQLPIVQEWIERGDLAAWIRWLERREATRFWSMAIMTFVGMIAAIIAAIEGMVH